MQPVLFLPVITDSSVDMLAIRYRTNVIVGLYRLLTRALVIALVGKLMDALDPNPLLKLKV